MFNSRSYSNAYNNLKINAVSGTLIKSHPKSFFKVLHSNSQLAERIFSEEPQMRISEERYYSGERKYENVIVLQVMLTGNEKYDLMVEIVRESDFLEEV